ncbi:MAG: hypothetical protein HY527_13645 [Betaproteobacteria bacterium]|nr:hypothetical protein [Betaproteobacteria bacterium]
MLRMQRVVEITRRFFKIESTASQPLPRAVRSYPIPAPAAWRWCLRDGVERNRWYHGEYPYSAAAARRGRD